MEGFRISCDKNYSEILTNSVNCNLDGFKELNSNVRASTLKMDFVDKESGKELLDLVIASNPVRPKTSILVGLKYRHSKREKILDFSDKIEERLLTLLNSFGGNQ